MIRVLHTGDWHIGQTLRGYGRMREHALAFAHIERIVVERAVDALVVAGDVFDSQNPSGESQRLFYEVLMRLRRARPEMSIVITAGNHDAAGRLEAPRPLLDAIGVHVVGNVRRRDGDVDLGHHLVPLRRGGEIAAQVLAVSYPTAACLPPLQRATAEGGSPIVGAVRTLYEHLFSAARPHLSGLPLVVTGHLHVAGGLESEGAERRILVGGEHAVPADVFPAAADYVALGHLHKAQRVGRESVRYSGSLIPLSAAEQPYAHAVTLVTLGDGPARIELVPIPRPLAFLRLPASGDMRLGELGDHLTALVRDLGLPADQPVDERPFVQVRLAREGLGAGHRAEIDRIADGFPVRVVDVRVAPLPEGAETQATAGPTLVRLAERDPEDLFRIAFARARGEAPGPDHLAVFHRARAEAEGLVPAG